MTDIPIIFSAPMIQALLAGRKTMTRRLLYTKRKAKDGLVTGATRLIGHEPPMVGRWPNTTPAHYWALSGWQRMKSGDRLWVREGLALGATSNAWKYRADDTLISMTWPDHRVAQMVAWAHHQERETIPPIYMPRWASRLTLVVSATKIESLQKISIADALAEGVVGDLASSWEEGYRLGSDEVWVDWIERDAILYSHPNSHGDEFNELSDDPRKAFRWLWGSLHGADAWAANPEVVALTFTVHKTNIDAMKVAA